MKTVLTIFATVFLAELGDKTQLATLLFAAGEGVNRPLVFLAASAALVTATLLAVLAGAAVTRVVSPNLLKIAAGVGFVAIGLWTIASAYRDWPS